MVPFCLVNREGNLNSQTRTENETLTTKKTIYPISSSTNLHNQANETFYRETLGIIGTNSYLQFHKQNYFISFQLKDLILLLLFAQS